MHIKPYQSSTQVNPIFPAVPVFNIIPTVKIYSMAILYLFINNCQTKTSGNVSIRGVTTFWRAFSSKLDLKWLFRQQLEPISVEIWFCICDKSQDIVSLCSKKLDAVKTPIKYPYFDSVKNAMLYINISGRGQWRVQLWWGFHPGASRFDARRRRGLGDDGSGGIQGVQLHESKHDLIISLPTEITNQNSVLQGANQRLIRLFSVQITYNPAISTKKAPSNHVARVARVT